MAGKGPCMGGKRCSRRKVSTTEDYIDKLNRLALACKPSAAELATIMICASLDSPQFVYSIQKKYTRDGRFWVSPKKEEGGKIKYEVEKGYDFVRSTRSILKDGYLDFPRPKRINVSLSCQYDRKLGMLSASLQCKKAQLAALILHFCLDSSHMIMQIQNAYCVYEHLRVTPCLENGVVSYIYLTPPA